MKDKCLQCVGEFIKASSAAKNGSVPELPEIRDAVTQAPSWQTTTIMGQFVVACVAVPTCMEHLNVSEKSAAQRAAGSGLALPGMG